MADEQKQPDLWDLATDTPDIATKPAQAPTPPPTVGPLAAKLEAPLTATEQVRRLLLGHHVGQPVTIPGVSTLAEPMQRAMDAPQRWAGGDKAGATSDVLRGLGTTVAMGTLPAVAGAGQLGAMLKTALPAMAVGYGAEKAAPLLNATPGQSQLIGDALGALAGSPKIQAGASGFAQGAGEAAMHSKRGLAGSMFGILYSALTGKPWYEGAAIGGGLLAAPEMIRAGASQAGMDAAAKPVLPDFGQMLGASAPIKTGPLSMAEMLQRMRSAPEAGNLKLRPFGGPTDPGFSPAPASRPSTPAPIPVQEPFSNTKGTAPGKGYPGPQQPAYRNPAPTPSKGPAPEVAQILSNGKGTAPGKAYSGPTNPEPFRSNQPKPGAGPAEKESYSPESGAVKDARQRWLDKQRPKAKQ